MLRILIILGTRPEAIKMAPIIRELRRYPERFQVRICATGQHRQMLDQVLDLFGIAADVDLDLMQSNQTPSQVAGRILLALEPLLQAECPDWVLVQGDTTTVMASAIAAHHLKIKVGHVEAGLRTGDRFNPFPEEMNRVIADHVSDLLFAPTERARRNLLQEGIPEARIHLTGNTVVDALLWAAAQPCPPQVEQILDGAKPVRDAGSASRVILVTAHRRESFGEPLRRICVALRELARRPDVHIIYPVHLNPHVQGTVNDLLSNVPRITLLPPVDYLTLVHLMKHSYLILTDSGGIQEEAPGLGVPVLVLREVTERPEAMEAGAARVVGTDPQHILAEAERLLDDETAYRAMSRAINPYGDGRAAERIVAALLDRS